MTSHPHGLADQSAIVPYRSPSDHLRDYLERVRLLLMRQLVRHFHRLTDSTGTLSDLFVSLAEVKRLADEAYGDTTPAEADLPTLPLVEQRLGAHRRRMFDRLSASLGEGARFPIEDLRAAFELEQYELDIVLVTVALQIDVGLHRLARFIWADFTLQQPTVGLVAEVVAQSPSEVGAIQEAMRPGLRLQQLDVVRLASSDRWSGATPMAHRAVSVPDRVTAFLQGHTPGLRHGTAEHDDVDRFCTWLIEPIELMWTAHSNDTSARFLAALRLATQRTQKSAGALASTPIVVLAGPPDAGPAELVRANVGVGETVLLANLSAPVDEAWHVETFAGRLRAALRESRLLDAIPVLSLGDLPRDHRRDELMAVLRQQLALYGKLAVVAASAGAPLIHRALGPRPEVPIQLPDPQRRRELWRKALPPGSEHPEISTVLDEVAQRYALTPSAIAMAAERALVAAEMRKKRRRDVASLAAADLRLAVRQQVEHQLGMLAEPFSTPLTWDDIVIPDDLRERLDEMIAYGRNGQRVHDEWGFGRLMGYGRGLTALFSGPPGTGKTMMAAIVAAEIGCELFRVDLSRVVDKYVGETEKNLGRIFDEAERSQAALLFDEADSLFGKRTSVSSANDRYANLEVNFLLQRMEHFDGTSILTTNHADGLDEAFARRLKFRLSFRIPDKDARLTLWKRMVPEQAPLADDIKWDKLAADFEMAPAHIKNAVMRAAFRAAQGVGTIDYATLRDAAVVEYRELGNLVRD